MGSKYAQEILDRTPTEVHIFVSKYADLVLRIQDILQEKGWSQKMLADRLGKNSSELSKWLSGGHNLTLRSIAKLEAELGEELMVVPARSTRSKRLPSTKENTMGNLNFEWINIACTQTDQKIHQALLSS